MRMKRRKEKNKRKKKSMPISFRESVQLGPTACDIKQVCLIPETTLDKTAVFSVRIVPAACYSGRFPHGLLPRTCSHGLLPRTCSRGELPRMCSKDLLPVTADVFQRPVTADVLPRTQKISPLQKTRAIKHSPFYAWSRSE